MIAKQLSSGCGVCGQKEGLLQCSSCKVLSYCGRDHQVADRPAHKSACSAIKRARVQMEKEKKIVRDTPGYFMIPVDPFFNSIGRFWDMLDTANYMEARFSLVREMSDVHNAQSVQAQLDHLMDMIRLSRRDEMGVRYYIPALMLRLNKDQECYDFMLWWKFTEGNSVYDWAESDPPYLDIQEADLFESPKPFCDESVDLSHLTCLCLLKIKLLLDIMRLEQSTASLGPIIPREIIDLIESSVPQSPVVRTSHDIMSGDGDARKTVLKTLEVQIDEIFHAVDEANEHFWPALIDDKYASTEIPECHSHGSEEEVAIFCSYRAWAETPGAIDFIKRKINGVD